MRYDRSRSPALQSDVGRAVFARWHRRVRRKMLGFVSGVALAIGIAASLFVVTFTRSIGANIAAAHWVAWIEGAPLVNAQANGAHVLIEGIVTKDSKILRHQFVAYAEQSKYNSRSGMGYEVDGLHRSAFAVDTRHRRYRLTSNTYGFSLRQGWWFGSLYPKFDALRIDWDHTAYRAGLDEGTPPGHIRLSGIVRGQPVIVIGRKATTDDVDPWYVLAGTRATLIGQLRSVGTSSWFWPNAILAVVCAFVGIGLIVGAIWELVRLATLRPSSLKR